MLLLSLDVSTKTGWSLHDGGFRLVSYGLIRVPVEDFNVNAKPGPETSPKYPRNILDASSEMAVKIKNLIDEYHPDIVVIENTVKGKNRHTQRILEWLHRAIYALICDGPYKIMYMDPSGWRSILNVRLSNADKKNNKMVTEGKKRGKVTRKHLSVRMANELYNLELKLKDNDVADSILLGRAAFEKVNNDK